MMKIPEGYFLINVFLLFKQFIKLKWTRICAFKISKSGGSILRLLTELRQIANKRIQMTASTEMARQKVLHQLWAENTKNMRKINQIRRNIEENRMKVSSIAAEKKEEIERYEFEKKRLNHKNSMALNRLM